MSVEKLKERFDANKFAMELEKIVREDRVGYIDALCHFAEKNNIEHETAAAWIRRCRPIMEKIEAEAIGTRMLQGDPSVCLDKFM